MNILKNIIIIYIFFVINIAAQSSVDITKKNDDTDLIKKSGIKTRTVWEYFYNPDGDNSLRDSGFKSNTSFYENTGRILEYTKYHVYPALTVKEIYRYNKSGKIIKTSRYNSNFDIIEEIDYKYSSSGKLKKEIHSAFYNSVRVGVYFTITANVNESDIFSFLQDELQIEPKLESFMITVNITDSEELNQYVVIGDESEPTSLRFSWSQLSFETQKGLLGYEGPNRKENSYKSKFISSVDFKYDKNGNLKDRSVYNTAGDLISRESFKYNVDNKKISYYKYNENGKLNSMETYSYDNNGKMQESIGLDPSGNTVSKLIYKYDDKGNLAEKLWVKSSGEVNSRFLFSYADSNRLKEEIKYRNENERENSTVYNYDENGNIIEIIRYDVNEKKEKLLKYIYEIF